MDECEEHCGKWSVDLLSGQPGWPESAPQAQSETVLRRESVTIVESGLWICLVVSPDGRKVLQEHNRKYQKSAMLRS